MKIRSTGINKYFTYHNDGNVITCRYFTSRHRLVREFQIYVGDELDNSEEDYRKLKNTAVKLAYDNKHIYFKNGVTCILNYIEERDLFILRLIGCRGDIGLSVSKKTWIAKAKALRFFHSLKLKSDEVWNEKRKINY